MLMYGSDEFMEELHDLATDRSFQHRLMFAQMCGVLLSSAALKVKVRLILAGALALDRAAPTADI